MVSPRRFLVFACATLLPDESEHHLLEGARMIGEVESQPIYHLVELPVHGALLEGGRSRIRGLLYDVPAPTLSAIDVARDIPRLFDRRAVALQEPPEEPVWGYFMDDDRCRGRRRVRHGDWKARFFTSRPRTGPWSEWAKNRYR